MKKFYDVTLPIFEGMPVYKNKAEKQPIIKPTTNGYVTESRLTLDAHTGTHIDAPRHMVLEGETFEELPLDKLIGNVKVFDLTNPSTKDRISKKDIENLGITEGDFVLFKTQNSFETEFNFEFVFIKDDAAAFLAEKKVRGVGIDALGVERDQPGHPTHKTLFGANILVIEGLALSEVKEGEYFMVASPLKLIGTDGAPARVVLFEK